jgi:hypothetical protein
MTRIIMNPNRVLEEAANDNHAIDRQLNRARQKWGRVGKVLSSQGAEPRVMGYFYKAIVQSVLLYDCTLRRLTS